MISLCFGRKSEVRFIVRLTIDIGFTSPVRTYPVRFDGIFCFVNRKGSFRKRLIACRAARRIAADGWRSFPAILQLYDDAAVTSRQQMPAVLLQVLVLILQNTEFLATLINY